MHPRTRELLDQLDTERAALRDAVQQVPAPLRDQRPSSDRWSVAEVLEHLTLIENRVALVLIKGFDDLRARNLAPEQEKSSVLSMINRTLILDRTRPITAGEAVRPHGELDAAKAWSALEEARRLLREAVQASDGLPLGEITQKHPVLGPLNLYQWVLFVAAHEGRHAAQIREIMEAFAER